MTHSRIISDLDFGIATDRCQASAYSLTHKKTTAMWQLMLSIHNATDLVCCVELAHSNVGEIFSSNIVSA